MKYTKRVALPSLLFLALAIAAGAQQTADSNPADQPNVFLDNHRPLIKKKQKTPTSRVVTGQVVDDSGTPLTGALVTLTNTKTHEKETFFTKKGGHYSFEGLSFSIDYEVQAKYKSLSSDARKLSQYDRTPRAVRILEVGSAPSLNQSVSTEAKKDPPKK
ncbi:MAG TPA: carboxypeptidase-like regulatory domain-containing protein [Bryobacteraceae bacterium]|nr:carboxypeptidase-like regulatory domain-containing protein [Bryobacteraceae bacterium]